MRNGNEINYQRHVLCIGDLERSSESSNNFMLMANLVRGQDRQDLIVPKLDFSQPLPPER
jgi:hypothetical protein